MVTRLLQLGDTVWTLIVPMLLSPFNIILIRSFFKKTIPEAILESARIDGASEARIFFQICLPLSLPGIATITLLTALGFWNDWFNALLYINENVTDQQIENSKKELAEAKESTALGFIFNTDV